MNRVDELVKLIQENNGNVEAIADSFINDLNEATKRYEANKKNVQKEKDAEALADHFNTFIKLYYPEAGGEIKGEDIITVWSAATEIMEEFKQVAKKSKGRTLEEMIRDMGW